jgi:hypothetical protein
MSADWNNPQLSINYIAFFRVKDRDVDALSLCIVDPTNSRKCDEV